MWFNPTVRSIRPCRSAGERDGTSHRVVVRTRWWVVGALVIVIGAVAAPYGRQPVVACRGHGGPPRFVDEPRPPASTIAYAGGFEYFVGGGVATFDCDDDGRPTCSSPAAANRPRSTATTARPAVRSRSAAWRPPITDLTASPAPTRSTSTATGSSISSCCARGGDVMLAGSATAGSSTPTSSLGLDGGDDVDGRPSAPTWEGSNDLPTLAFGGYLVADTRVVCATAASSGRAAGDSYGPPVALSPGYCTLSILFSDWSRSGRARPAHDERPALLPRRHRPAVAHRARRRRRARTPRPTAGGRCRSGAWASPARTSPVTAGPRCSSRARATTSCRRSPTAPSQPDVRRHRAASSGSRPTARSPAATCCRRRRGTPSSRTSTTTASSTCSSPRATSRPQLGYATRDPNNLLIGQADGTFVEGGRGGRHRQLRAVAWCGARRPQPRRDARPRRRQP